LLGLLPDVALLAAPLLLQHYDDAVKAAEAPEADVASAGAEALSKETAVVFADASDAAATATAAAAATDSPAALPADAVVDAIADAAADVTADIAAATPSDAPAAADSPSSEEATEPLPEPVAAEPVAPLDPRLAALLARAHLLEDALPLAPQAALPPTAAADTPLPALRPHLVSSQIGVVTPYLGQVRAIKRVLAETHAKLRGSAGRQSVGPEHALDRVEVRSVDGFQGREKEIIVFSCVRSNNRCILGFLRDIRRLNVAITRAKRGLVLVGNSVCLSSDPMWASFIEYLREMRAVVPVASLSPYLATGSAFPDYDQNVNLE
jgi:hypothetical protein